MTRPEIYLIAAGVAVVAVLLARSTASAASVGESVGTAAVDLADGLVTGVVTGLGEVAGIPKTEPTRGEAALERGDYLEASFYLPAGDFISGVWAKVTN